MSTAALTTFDLQDAPCGLFTFGDDLRIKAANQTPESVTSSL